MNNRKKDFNKVVEWEKGYFSEMRDGDNLTGIAFQCELCHISNIEGRKLMSSDEGILVFMRRVNLDTL